MECEFNFHLSLAQLGFSGKIENTYFYSDGKDEVMLDLNTKELSCVPNGEDLGFTNYYNYKGALYSFCYNSWVTSREKIRKYNISGLVKEINNISSENMEIATNPIFKGDSIIVGFNQISGDPVSKIRIYDLDLNLINEEELPYYIGFFQNFISIFFQNCFITQFRVIEGEIIGKKGVKIYDLERKAVSDSIIFENLVYSSFSKNLGHQNFIIYSEQIPGIPYSPNYNVLSFMLEDSYLKFDKENIQKINKDIIPDLSLEINICEVKLSRKKNSRVL